MKLVRHNQDKFHKNTWHGIVLEDYGYKVMIRWINPKSNKYTKLLD